jgi:ribosomal protein L13
MPARVKQHGKNTEILKSLKRADKLIDVVVKDLLSSQALKKQNDIKLKVYSTSNMSHPLIDWKCVNKRVK